MNSLLKNYLNEFLEPYLRGSIKNVQTSPLRQDSQVRSQVPGILGLKPQPAQEVAVAIIASPEGKFLAVSRPNDPFKFGFPGGHIEHGETPEEAVTRELKEETGLIGSPVAKLASLRNSRGRKIHFFICEAEGEINTSESGIIKWLTPTELLGGAFSDETKTILRMLGLHKHTF